MRIEVGTTVKDSITGIEGVVIARTDFLNGCTRYCVERVNGDLNITEDWFDEPRLSIVEDKPVHEGDQITGGDGPKPPARSTGQR